MNDLQHRLAGFARNEIRALKATLKEHEVERLELVLREQRITSDNIYKLITGHHNSPRSLNLIRMCAPILYSATSLEDLKKTVETWSKRVLCIEYGDEDEHKTRLFWSPLELVFTRATTNELSGIISYLVGETNSLMKFEPNLWDFSYQTDLQEVRA